MVATKPVKIKCDFCKTTFNFDDDAVDGIGSAECLPDGYLFDGKWMCDACGSCPECGRTLEKEPEKRGPNARPCRYCVMEIADGRWPFNITRCALPRRNASGKKT